jgi:hypothetical protein
VDWFDYSGIREQADAAPDRVISGGGSEPFLIYKQLRGEGGGYIIAPCHNIQVVGPPENGVAMYQTGYEESWA